MMDNSLQNESMTEPQELKTVDSMPGSINELISIKSRLRRPPSLSESFAWTPENIERAYRTSSINQTSAYRTSSINQTSAYRTSLFHQVSAYQTPLLAQEEKPPPEPIEVVVPPQPFKADIAPLHAAEARCIRILIKLLLHITLISIFETVFFFLYVSTLEDSGIQSTVNGFINKAVQSCMNLTQPEKVAVNDLLSIFVNVSQIIDAGNQETVARNQYNQLILKQAWYYVGGLSGFFLFVVVYSKIRKVAIQWGRIVAENTAMVLLLALYEYMFFETIIYKYRPITASEIERNAVEEFQASCGIL